MAQAAPALGDAISLRGGSLGGLAAAITYCQVLAKSSRVEASLDRFVSVPDAQTGEGTRSRHYSVADMAKHRLSAEMMHEKDTWRAAVSCHEIQRIYLYTLKVFCTKVR